jgi:hypothetical protein
MASRIDLFFLEQWKYPWLRKTYKDDKSKGKYPIIAKGNIIEGIEAKE